MKIYLAGPMRGHPEFNFPAFIQKAEELRHIGWEVFSPAERDMAEGFEPWGLKGDMSELDGLGFNLREAIADDLDYICRQADGVYFLPGSSESSGAKLERQAAIFCGLELMGERWI